MDTKEMLETYPELFGTDLDSKRSLTMFGIETGEGWREIVLKNLPKISKIVKENNIENFRITQIKEKFGRLVVYAMGANQEIQDIIQKMSNEATKICEECGSKEGKFRKEAWRRVSCDECEEKRKREIECL